MRGAAGDVPILLQNLPEMAGEPQPAHPTISALGEKMAKIIGVPRDVHVGCFWGGGLGSVCRDSTPMCSSSLSQQKGIPCHLCQVAVSVVGKILQDNRTEVGLSRDGERGWCSCPPALLSPEHFLCHPGKAAGLLG